MDREGLTQLDLMILVSIGKSSDLSSVAKAAKISQTTLGMKIAKLQLEGYIGEDGILTDKGKEALANPSRSR